MKIVRLKEATSDRWSAGTTTELFIYPEGSSFSAANFSLRVSIATVEEETSHFTPFPGTQRTLLVLEGHQHLTHPAKNSVELHKLDMHSFSGDWTTECVGKSTNFNVMTRGESTAEVEVVHISEASIVEIGNEDQIQFLFILDGRLISQNQKITPKEGVLLTSRTFVSMEQSTQYVLVTYPKIGKY